MTFDVTNLSAKILGMLQNADNKATGEKARNGEWLDSDKEISLFIKDASTAIQNGEVEIAEVKHVLGNVNSAEINKAASKAPSNDTPRQSDEEFIDNLRGFSAIQDKTVQAKVYLSAEDKITDYQGRLDNNKTAISTLLQTDAKYDQQKKDVLRYILSQGTPEAKKALNDKLAEIFDEAIQNGDADTTLAMLKYGYHPEGREYNLMILSHMSQEIQNKVATYAISVLNEAKDAFENDKAMLYEFTKDDAHVEDLINAFVQKAQNETKAIVKETMQEYAKEIESTGINTPEADKNKTNQDGYKTFENGQVVIHKNGHKYNTNGSEIQ